MIGARVGGGGGVIKLCDRDKDCNYHHHSPLPYSPLALALVRAKVGLTMVGCVSRLWVSAAAGKGLGERVKTCPFCRPRPKRQEGR